MASTFVLTNCDVIAKVDYRAILDWHRNSQSQLTILGVRRRTQIPYGVIELAAGNVVVSITEKPSFHHLIMSGIYVLEPSVLACIPPGRPFGLDELIVECRKCRKHGLRVTCFEIAEGWFDMGEFEEYKSLLRHFEGLNV
jgi:NDP-sugar pyrophosphorylase family protein